MPNTTRGVGLFTAENIVAVLRAIPESDGTYRDVASKAEQYGGNVHDHTISNWLSHGRPDIEAGQPYRLRQIHQTVPRPGRRALRTGHQPEPRIRPGTRDPKTDLRVRQRQSTDARRKAEQYVPGVPRLGHTTTAPANSIRTPASHHLRSTTTIAGVQKAIGRPQVTKGQESTTAALQHVQERLRRECGPSAVTPPTNGRAKRLTIGGSSSRPFRCSTTINATKNRAQPTRSRL